MNTRLQETAVDTSGSCSSGSAPDERALRAFTVDAPLANVPSAEGSALGLVERLRNGGQPDLADMAEGLLEACRAIVAWDEAEKNAKLFDEDGGAGFYRRIGMCHDAFNAARAAIEKATGEGA